MNDIRTKYHKILNKIKTGQDQIIQLQANCPHEHVEEKHKGNTGNYDGDYFWIEYTCQDCGKFWSEDVD